MDNDASICESIRALVHGILADVHTSMPGIVESFNCSGKIPHAVVKPMIMRKYRDGTDAEYGKIDNVPVIYPSCANAGIFFPLEKGDYVLLIISERSLENWLLTGKIASASYSRLFNMQDAIAIPGLFPFISSKRISAVDLEIVYKEQKMIIKSNGDIEIGGQNVKKLLCEAAGEVFNNHVHMVTTSGTPAAQQGTTSSPVSAVPGDPLQIAPSSVVIPTPFADKIGSMHMTEKVRAQ